MQDVLQVCEMSEKRKVKKMREILLSSAHFREDSNEKIKQKDYTNRWKYVLIFSISSALLFGGTGLIISGLAYFGLIEHAKIMSRIGTILIVVSAPLFILAAHCLDEMKFEERRNRTRLLK
jgi:hypothetical protein